MAEIQKKLTMRKSTLLTGFLRVIIIIAETTAAAEKISINMFSNVNCNIAFFLNRFLIINNNSHINEYIQLQSKLEELISVAKMGGSQRKCPGPESSEGVPVGEPTSRYSFS